MANQFSGLLRSLTEIVGKIAKILNVGETVVKVFSDIDKHIKSLDQAIRMAHKLPPPSYLPTTSMADIAAEPDPLDDIPVVEEEAPKKKAKKKSSKK